jgi:hypothetical protein
LDFAASLWNSAPSLIAPILTRPQARLGIIPLNFVVFLLIPTLPVFYFALCRNEGTLRISRGHRMIGAGAAIVLGIIVAARVPGWIGSLSPFWTSLKTTSWRTGGSSVLAVVGDPTAIRLIPTAMQVFGNAAYILLLIALCRHTTDESSVDVPASSLLRIVTKVAFIAWGVLLIGSLGRVLMTPSAYFQMREYSYRYSSASPKLLDMMVDAIRTLLSQACLFAAPYIVYESRLEPSSEPELTAQEHLS